jgi:hypothetical protein
MKLSSLGQLLAYGKSRISEQAAQLKEASEYAFPFACGHRQPRRSVRLRDRWQHARASLPNTSRFAPTLR